MPRQPRPSPSLETWLVDTLDVLAAVVAGGLIAVDLSGGQGTARILLALGFLMYVPGRAVTANWAQAALWSQVGLAMLLSLAILAVVATVTLWAHYWHPIGLMQAEAGLSLLGLAVAVTRRHWPGFPLKPGHFHETDRAGPARPGRNVAAGHARTSRSVTDAEA
ncbi:MAG TPA: hypothetical protein VLM11_13340 [Streptosporangiaceae bacterium]|nr:hypothetical protein [Streptosporangiaceae bacterium]